MLVYVAIRHELPKILCQTYFFSLFTLREERTDFSPLVIIQYERSQNKRILWFNAHRISRRQNDEMHTNMLVNMITNICVLILSYTQSIKLHNLV